MKQTNKLHTFRACATPTEDQDAEYATNFTVTGPCTADEFALIWEAAVSSAKARDSEYQFDGIVRVLRRKGYKFKFDKPTDVSVGY